MCRVLLVRLSAIGDIVHTMPTALAIKRAHPNWTVDWVVQRNYADLVVGHPGVANVVPVSRRQSLSELLALRRQLRGSHYDIALDMQGLFKSGIIVGVSGARKKLGYHWQREGSRLFSRPIHPVRTDAHVVEQYMAVAAALGGGEEVVGFGLSANPEDLERTKRLMVGRGISGRTLALNLGAKHEFKRWPRRSFAKLIDAAESMGWTPFLVGAESERMLAEELFAALGRQTPSLLGETSIGELVAAIHLSDAHVAGDTGSIHIAGALGKPLICVIPDDGRTVRPERTGPYGRREFTLSKPNTEDIPPEDAIELLRRL